LLYIFDHLNSYLDEFITTFLQTSEIGEISLERVHHNLYKLLIDAYLQRLVLLLISQKNFKPKMSDMPRSPNGEFFSLIPLIAANENKPKKEKVDMKHLVLDKKGAL
jgi:hypothetical protein